MEDKNLIKNTLISNKIFILIWRLIIVVLGFIGIIPMIRVSTSGLTFCYFTMQTNILILLLFIVLLIKTITSIFCKTKEYIKIPAWIQFGITYYIQITFLVYAIMLSGSVFSMGSDIRIANLLLHYFIPVMALLDWFMFMPHGLLNYKHAILWLIYPALYVVFSFVRAAVGDVFTNGSRFPYFFMDADVLGYNLIWIFVVFFSAFYLLGFMLVLIDKNILKLRKTRQAS